MASASTPSRWGPARTSRRRSSRAPRWCVSARPSSDRVNNMGNNHHVNYTAAFIGGGNMGGALIRGLIAKGLPAGNISGGEAVQARRIALADELGVHVSADNGEIVEGADLVVLAVKPQDMATTVRVLAPGLARRRPVVLS